METNEAERDAERAARKASLAVFHSIVQGIVDRADKNLVLAVEDDTLDYDTSHVNLVMVDTETCAHARFGVWQASWAGKTPYYNEGYRNKMCFGTMKRTHARKGYGTLEAAVLTAIDLLEADFAIKVGVMKERREREVARAAEYEAEEKAEKQAMVDEWNAKTPEQKIAVFKDDVECYESYIEGKRMDIAAYERDIVEVKVKIAKIEAGEDVPCSQ
jgi:hypothetical protein